MEWFQSLFFIFRDNAVTTYGPKLPRCNSQPPGAPSDFSQLALDKPSQPLTDQSSHNSTCPSISSCGSKFAISRGASRAHIAAVTWARNDALRAALNQGRSRQRLHRRHARRAAGRDQLALADLRRVWAHRRVHRRRGITPLLARQGGLPRAHGSSAGARGTVAAARVVEDLQKDS